MRRLAILLVCLFIQADVFVDGVVRASELEIRPKVIEKRLPSSGGPPPQIPEGELKIEFVIEQDGTVRHIRAASPIGSYQTIHDRAIALLRRWTFKAGTQKGAPVRSLATLTISLSSKPYGRRGAGPLERVTETWAINGADDDFAVGAAKPGDPGVTWPRSVKEHRPKYPPELLKEKINATVELEVIVLGSGKIGAMRIISSTDDRFEAAALESARQWEFEGGGRAGQPGPVLVVLMLEFLAR